MALVTLGRLPERRGGMPIQLRTVVLASADSSLRLRLRSALHDLRWQVREASGAAEAIAQLDRDQPEALLIDTWLPDLEAGEFSRLLQDNYPEVDLLRFDGVALSKQTRSVRRHELLAALRSVQTDENSSAQRGRPVRAAGAAQPIPQIAEQGSAAQTPQGAGEITGLIGDSAPMRELLQMIRLVAPRNTTVLIEGETGTGKEVVAQALHRLSARADQPMVVLNCAAIPESLLEAELFGHTRGAFTGAVQSRVGRIETADGGTLFLDEIGEMPLALQAKLLRFLECGELQRVGDNSVSRVDVRVIAATHQPLEQRSEEGAFRLDLYHRLAVFPIELPPLRDRMDDLPALAEHCLDELGRSSPRKRLTPDALEELLAHRWPGNVRELMHVLERAVILSGDSPEIARTNIRVRKRPRA